MQGDPQGSAVNATASIGCARVFKQINKLKIESFRRMTSSVDFKSDTKMRSYKERLASFDKTWPYDSDCNCSAEKMAEAGFYHIVSTEWPDLVRCFYCRKELDGWEPHENPWEEHAKRNCPFIKKGKKSRDLTVEDYFELEAERLCHIMSVRFDEFERQIQSHACDTKKKIKEMAAEKQANGRRRRKK